ncbi:hypothetical protein G6F45_012741 [Rhizopus arrhizus]|uniref:Uncharacterized protein n=1 Tax=Rhizopus oryzae TaxID=64495 RepID=A0A9P7C2V2_RHIOR|nr:hypothetical protein G6F51_012908 [Rhizopus arrhizus]KAG1613802.1 hypothetical protein G6F45_012741 [Rhizopus arrhizus]
MHLETEQNSDLDQEVISINNDDNEELLEIEAFEVDDEVHNSFLLTTESIMEATQCTVVMVMNNRSLPTYDTLSILYFWSLKVRRMTIFTMVGCSPYAVRETSKDWYQVLQDDLQQNDCKIGGYDVDGNSIVVEIDESKCGKRKYHRGHRVEGVWMVGSVEKTPERNVTFRDGDVHTNTIEETWNGTKINVTPTLRTKKMIPWLLIEFIWRRKHHNHIFGGISDCLKDVSFDRAQRNPAWLTELDAE